MLTGLQIRAARALLGLSSEELAKRVGLSGVTIRNIENGINKRPQTKTIKQIELILGAAGIEFTDGEGVRRRPRGIEIFEGQERFNEFMDFLLNDVKRHGGEVRASVTDERVYQKHIQNIEVFRREMMELDKAGRIKGRILAIEGNFIRTWADIRRSPKTSQIAPVSFYVFNENFALISFTNKNSPYVELHKSSLFAGDFRRLFDMAWESAEKP